mgnify:CR=1 FL=1
MIHFFSALFNASASLEITAGINVIIPFTIAIIAPAIWSIVIINLIILERFSPINSLQLRVFSLIEISGILKSSCTSSQSIDQHHY